MRALPPGRRLAAQLVRLPPHVRTPPYLRWRGYTAGDLATLHARLDEAGRAAFRRMLKIDLGFPIVYGIGGGLAVSCLARHGADGAAAWIASFVLVLLAVADWTENLLLLDQFPPTEPAAASRVRIASVATRAKLVALIVFGGALLTMAWTMQRA